MKKVTATSWILRYLKSHPSVTSDHVVQALGISRQTATEHLRKLVSARALEKLGSTKSAQYRLAKKTKKARKANERYRAIKKRLGLDEHDIFERMNQRLSLSRNVSPKAHDIASYAFTEMLNNAVDHSGSQTVEITSGLRDGYFEFTIRDRGVGIFEKIRSTFGLSSDDEALEFLLKGKKTTMPDRHSGEGIFFTSKIADFFGIRSHRLELIFDNENKDHAVRNIRPLKGSEISFRIKKSTRKKLIDLFHQFTNERFEFDRSIALVKLVPKIGHYVSRSEAKRIVHGLQDFNRIDLDFSGIAGIGQAFADEIFRVYQGAHPQKTINALHANQAVTFMIHRARSNLTIENKKPYN